MPWFEQMVEAENHSGLPGRRLPHRAEPAVLGSDPALAADAGRGGTGKFGDKAPADPVMVGGLKFLTH
jgi:hypothetical protein